MDVILSSVKWRFALVYLDKILTFRKASEQHINNICRVLWLLNDDGVTLKLNNCSFFFGIFDYLDHFILSRRLKLLSHTKNAIRELKQLTSLTKLRSFLDLIYVFRQFEPPAFRNSRLRLTND